jgi:hypothetical protein
MRHVPAAEDGFNRDGYLLANPDLYDVAENDPSWDAYEHLLRFGIEEKRYMYVGATEPEMKTPSESIRR